MKLVTFKIPSGARHIGALIDGEQQIVDFTASDNNPCLKDMLSFIDGGKTSLDLGKHLLTRLPKVVSLSDVTLQAPVPEPRQMRDFLTFEMHVRQARANRHLLVQDGTPTDPANIQIASVWYESPLYYKCNRFSVIGSGEDIRWPSYANVLDYELEFGIFIAKDGMNIPAAEAKDYIFGYSIFNDVSARDVQMKEMQMQLGPSKGKDFDTGNVIGPWLVTADEIPDPRNLTATARVNGEVWSQSTTRDMRYSFADMVVHVSKDEKIKAGEFFGSGTVGGGCGLEFGRFLKPGDIVELEFSGLGILKNQVVKA